MTNTLVIDTSYGSTVGVVGYEPVIERDSRTHVERLQVDIGTATSRAGLQPSDIERIVVGVGPAPFTGLRAGIVTAKALAFATGAELLGQDILSVQAGMMAAHRHGEFSFPKTAELLTLGRQEALPSSASSADVSYVTLAVNDARRRQLYFTVMTGADDAASYQSRTAGDVLIDMDIDYPQRIAERVGEAVRQRDNRLGTHTAVDIVGHGAAKYAACWSTLSRLGLVLDTSVLDMGAHGLAWYANYAHSDRGTMHAGKGNGSHGDRVADSRTRRRAVSPADTVEPLYLRRPDVSVPNPLKHVLHHAGADRAE
ncbi:tRNA (adenosine(37)-N6)-threonylcarbamoyltransferase complex dimerization subunit type 1 TsaB [Bifidobacterium sp.]|jgi:tRNA threonylcarbamoyl adenosine modification protein YeaZ|uniref:tRNA (adenosine(37)-N6)-threonylcarbamoyltransferase complex dimerization subunit type 1 TsaB n=1 Tax=Bifidobacterium sp. TaxID=41200 RepID=UPI0025BFB507|nr:tRNA (adenosine(37)-N6)-threonylcarbamoyltransferase complex dimerization subunit type 1 TsaB [Bifidobacterium sp.]MCH4208598.1 tRNA (adenosine(37)-N6)-threonylcarbamoyltransferase complex dimerization subunit type 1 TsaB [Bifidobacterium sp.]MCI1224284.1 tRNA (adenosine(37)-N6)-threonylcarbamoyltransferase complex dimerization subunit type 1 TsaB [Bifidobacterium sp.]